MALRVIDDRDPAIEYTGVWRPEGNPQEEYNGTTTFSEIPGSTARVTFTGKHFIPSVDSEAEADL